MEIGSTPSSIRAVTQNHFFICTIAMSSASVAVPLKHNILENQLNTKPK